MKEKNHSNQRRNAPEPTGAAGLSTNADAPLSTHRAFVVQLRKTTGELAGRVEHIISGEATLFSCERELLDFLKQTLQKAAAANKDREHARRE